ncbi:MAG: hypothetical protein DRG30_05840 [Epsilonproteobacteria bacterium]|nr:MAG: hypothetical protein DRG30_05840 [Campylobacterota bacterium]
MIDFSDSTLRIKQIISKDQKKQRIYNKDIAEALGLTPEYFAVIKKRGKIPYEAIAYFCKERQISINWILFGQELRSIKDSNTMC